MLKMSRDVFPADVTSWGIERGKDNYEFTRMGKNLVMQSMQKKSFRK